MTVLQIATLFGIFFAVLSVVNAGIIGLVTVFGTEPIETIGKYILFGFVILVLVFLVILPIGEFFVHRYKRLK